MRTRTRTIVRKQNPGYSNVTGFWSGYGCNGTFYPPAVSGGLSSSSFPEDYLSEAITDVAGPKLPIRDKPVWHRKRDSQLYAPSSLNTMTVPVPGGLWSVQTLTGQAGLYNAFAWSKPEDALYSAWPLTNGQAGYDSPPPMMDRSLFTKSDTTLLNDVYKKAEGLEADILLNIAESGQFIPSLKALTTDLLKLSDDPRFLHGSRWGALRLVLRTASAGYLAWKFGIGPLLQDMTRVYNDVSRMRAELEKFVSGKTLRYTSVATASHTLQSGKDFEISTVQNGVNTRIVKRDLLEVVRPTRRVVMRVRPNTSSVNRLIRQLEGLRYRYATPPAQLAWELTPFSFIVDWFVDVRGALRAIDQMLGQVPYIVVSKSRSFTYRTKITRRQMHYSACDGSLIGAGVQNECVYSHYERSPISDDHSIAWRNRFGKNQAAITAALITQFLTGANLRKWGYVGK